MFDHLAVVFASTFCLPWKSNSEPQVEQKCPKIDGKQHLVDRSATSNTTILPKEAHTKSNRIIIPRIKIGQGTTTELFKKRHVSVRLIQRMYNIDRLIMPRTSTRHMKRNYDLRTKCCVFYFRKAHRCRSMHEHH